MTSKLIEKEIVCRCGNTTWLTVSDLFVTEEKELCTGRKFYCCSNCNLKLTADQIKGMFNDDK